MKALVTVRAKKDMKNFYAKRCAQKGQIFSTHIDGIKLNGLKINVDSIKANMVKHFVLIKGFDCNRDTHTCDFSHKLVSLFLR